MTLKDIQKQIDNNIKNIDKALAHLQYSLNKVQQIPADFDLEDFELLETFESFTSRFARLSDIMAKKLIRSLVLKDDPSFSGGLMDYLNQAEKLHFISDANKWWEVRSLRNKEALEYTDSDLRIYFQTIQVQSEFLILETTNLLKQLCD